MTFTQVASPYTEITVDAVAGTIHMHMRPIRQTLGVAADGTVKGSKPADYVHFIDFMVRCTEAQLVSLRNFAELYVGIPGDTFTVTPDAGTNLGAGDGVAITARFWGDGLEQPQRAYGIWLVSVQLRREV